MKAHVQTADNFPRISFVLGKLSLLAQHFRLFLRRPSAPYRLAPWAAARLAHPLGRA